MYHLYIDEFGDSSILKSVPATTQDSLTQPFVILAGVIIMAEHIPILTNEIIKLKKRYFPNAIAAGNTHNLTWLQVEIKGANLKKAISNKDLKKVKTYKRFFNEIFNLLDFYEVKIVSKCFVKKLDTALKIENIYTSCVQEFCNHFQDYLKNSAPEAYGSVILDSRDHHKDKGVAFSIATQKYKSGLDRYPNLLEVPTFGTDNNHIGIQICDWIVSGVIVPICGITYISPFLPNNIFAKPQYSIIQNLYANRIRRLQYRYQDLDGHFHGGLRISDPNGRLNATAFFK